MDARLSGSGLLRLASRLIPLTSRVSRPASKGRGYFEGRFAPRPLVEGSPGVTKILRSFLDNNFSCTFFSIFTWYSIWGTLSTKKSSRNDLKTMKRITDPDDPNRCQHVKSTGQCINVSEPYSKNCLAHGGNRAGEEKARQEMNNYHLTKFRARTSELVSSNKLTSLRDEVALLRMIIEEKVNRCTDTSELILVSGPLADLIMKCGALVEKCHKLEHKLGDLLDRNEVVQFAQMCVDIISSHIDDEETLDSISNAILEALTKV